MSSVTAAAPKRFQASRDSAPAYWMLDILWTVLATGEQTGGRFSVLEQIMPEGAAPPPHVHPFSVEVFYLLDGEIAYTVSGTELSARTGSLVVVPRNSVHSFRVGSESAHVLNFYLPAGWEQVFPDLTRPAERRELPPKGLDDVHSASVTRFLNNYWGSLADVSYAAQALAPALGSERPARNPAVPAAPLAVSGADAPARVQDGMTWTILADAAAIGGLLSAAAVSAPAGTKTPSRVLTADTALYVLSGRLTVTGGGEMLTAEPGGLVCLPEGAEAAVSADGDSRFLQFAAPGRDLQ